MEIRNWEVVIEVDGFERVYGIYDSLNKANETAAFVREYQSVPVSVYELVPVTIIVD